MKYELPGISSYGAYLAINLACAGIADLCLAKNVSTALYALATPDAALVNNPFTGCCVCLVLLKSLLKADICLSSDGRVTARFIYFVEILVAQCVMCTGVSITPCTVLFGVCFYSSV